MSSLAKTVKHFTSHTLRKSGLLVPEELLKLVTDYSSRDTTEYSKWIIYLQTLMEKYQNKYKEANQAYKLAVARSISARKHFVIMVNIKLLNYGKEPVINDLINELKVQKEYYWCFYDFSATV